MSNFGVDVYEIQHGIDFYFSKKLYNHNRVRTLTMNQMRSEIWSVRVVLLSLLEKLGIIEFGKCGELVKTLQWLYIKLNTVKSVI